jgi:hypothetical protein
LLEKPLRPLSGQLGPQEAALVDSAGLALLVVLDTLAPGDRLAFVLHDVFSVPFEEIAAMVDRTPDATASSLAAVNIAKRALMFARPGTTLQPVLVTGLPGVVVLVDGQPRSIMSFTVVASRITAIDGLSDPERIRRLDLAAIHPSSGT